MSKFKFDWGHGIALGLGSFMIFILTLIFLADDTGDLISEEYYEESLVFQEEKIDARNRVKHLDDKPEIIDQANGYNIQFPEAIVPDSGQVYLMRGAHKANDILLPLDLNSRNSILIPAARLTDGEYDMELTWYQEGKPYIIEKTLKWNMP
ncbi:FixH family protein [Weeksellaceae bacterium KMM 9713]|uniref:FixH family protein n=1 Tax=Profundicola chukchiensis TaxID=2961959 RepID=A0A9X4MXC1_9FLAO|nr:FixH family protein [Profundicola chukchiensis]MDG4945265.1 FixH family protein [Profundicola chukchiensis]MDG4950338.1 FixH family protein [Profundicola chukchiensis]